MRTRQFLYPSQLECCSSSASKAAEIRAKAYVVEIRFRQLAEEEKMRKQQAEIQLKLKRQIQRAQEEAELARREADEERKIRQAEDEAACLAAEASVLGCAVNHLQCLNTCFPSSVVLQPHIFFYQPLINVSFPCSIFLSFALLCSIALSLVC